MIQIDRSTLIGFESHFNRHFQSEFSSPIYRRGEFDSKFESEFESNFKFGPRIVEFDRKGWFISKIGQNSPKIGKFDSNLTNFWYKSTRSI